MGAIVKSYITHLSSGATLGEKVLLVLWGMAVSTLVYRSTSGNAPICPKFLNSAETLRVFQVGNTESVL